MYITINEPGDVRIAYIDPVSGKAWDPTTRTLQPFDPKTHLLPFAPVNVVAAEGATVPAGLFAGLKAVDDGGALGADSRLIGVLVNVDGAGAPLSIQAAVPNPYATGQTPYGPAFSRA